MILRLFNQFKMNVMKKMNRSQSSYRQCKTLINEDDSDSWISKLHSRNNSRPQLNIANSYIEANKENNSLFQSVSERNFPTSKSIEKVAEFDHGEDILLKLQEKCKRQEEHIRRLYSEREEYLKGSAHSSSSNAYNYSQKYYQSEIESLKSLIRQKEKELEFFRQQSSCRNEEMDSMTSDISTKMDRDQRDKNLYIKEINHKTIEISHLQERVKYHKAQIQTLKMYINEKDKTIKDYEEKIGQTDMKKKKIQNYESQLKQSNEFLKELETQTQRLKEETERKDSMIAEKGQIISELEQTIGSYEDKLRSIEHSLIKIKEDKKSMLQQNENLKQECEDWRKSYDDLLLKSDSLQEYQIKLKTYQGMLEDANKRNMELMSSNEKYKISLTSLQKTMAKYQEVEKEAVTLKRELKEKEEKIMQFQAREKDYKHLDDCYTKLRKEKDENFLKMQEKIKENKSLALQLSEKKAVITGLEEELEEIQFNNNRVKDRGEKMDILMKENDKLNTLVIEKVGEIQKLQIKMNSMDNKMIEKNNENIKLKATISDREQEITEVKIEVEDLRQRYETETSNRMLSEDKVTRCNQEIMAQRSLIEKIERDNKQYQDLLEQTTEKHESQLQQMKDILTEMQTSKQGTLVLLQESKQNAVSLKSEVLECRKVIDESVAKQKEHRTSLLRLEKELTELREESLTLQGEKVQIVEKCEGLKQIYDFVMKFKDVSIHK